MKLAALGVIAVVVGLVGDVDGLVLTGAIWIPGGLIIRLVHGPIDRDREIKPTWRDAFGGRRGAASGLLIVVGIASVVIGAVPIVFEPSEAWRWIPVAVGGFAAGTQLLALAGFGLGSGLQAITGNVGDPTHPAHITLDAIDETGVRINDQPRLAMDLTVEPQGRAAYQVTIKQVVALSELGAARVGTTYRGLVDLEVPEGVRIDWHDVVDDGSAGGSAESVEQRLRRVDQLLGSGAISPEEHAAARRNILDDL